MTSPRNAEPLSITAAFATLGIAPTPQRDAVKRAYFAALQKHPPQRDPAGFQRVRAAYERLLAPGALEAVGNEAQTSAQRLFAQLDAALEPALREVTTASARTRDETAMIERFEQTFSRTTWREAVDAVAAKRPPQRSG